MNAFIAHERLDEYMFNNQTFSLKTPVDYVTFFKDTYNYDISKLFTDDMFYIKNIFALSPLLSTFGKYQISRHFIRVFKTENCIDSVDYDENGDTYTLIDDTSRIALLLFISDVIVSIQLFNKEVKLTAEKYTPDQKTYIMYDKTFGAYKIGRSKDPSFREKTLGAQFPNITLFAVHKNDIEHKLHKAYASKIIRGEWFRLDNDDLKSIMKLGFSVT